MRDGGGGGGGGRGGGGGGTVDAGYNGGEHEDQQESESKKHQGRRLARFVEVVEEAGVGDDAAGKQVGRQTLQHSFRKRCCGVGVHFRIWWWRWPKMVVV
jgi:hypothetical protein